ncbi:hypothetical protein M378DRAFT_160359 [Amanita muscaria Koide BX008]|uniref:DUF6534 domain-containing protein n=1 Tax=Amanita muscaria (strain Koide BX008) TaxID=946122 RepID=A0A0C2XBU5_AMAMK|nr:hypothetical protein M378DRAFT_160359 [Amanita muscaria Koide BX008]
MSSPTASLCAIGASVWQYYGPLFLGGVSATFFSGMMAIQTIVYVKLYHKDIKYMKALVGPHPVCAIDVAQTGLTWNALWYYLVRNFGDFTKLDDLPINRNFWIAAPIAILMTIRFRASVEMIHLKKFTILMTRYKWLITLGLCCSIIVDVTITATLAFLLLIKSRGRLEVGNQVMVLTSLNDIADSLILYTLELGSVTGLTSILSLIFWLQLDNHMVFTGLYISFGKLYGNCLMAMLNMRYSLRQKRPMTREWGTKDWRPHPQVTPGSSLSLPVHVHVDVSRSTQSDNGNHYARKLAPESNL